MASHWKTAVDPSGMVLSTGRRTKWGVTKNIKKYLVNMSMYLVVWALEHTCIFWCLGWAALFYSGTPRAFHIIIINIANECVLQRHFRTKKTVTTWIHKNLLLQQ